MIQETVLHDAIIALSSRSLLDTARAFRRESASRIGAELLDVIQVESRAACIILRLLATKGLKSAAFRLD